MHSNNNNKHHSKVINITKASSAITKVSRNEEELLHSSSEDELSPVSVEAFCAAGIAPNSIKLSLMKLIKKPCDNVPAIRRLHNELFKLLHPNPKNPITTCSHPLQPEIFLNCALMAHGSS